MDQDLRYVEIGHLTESEIDVMKLKDNLNSKASSFPNTKISETILDFAAPYLDLLPTIATDKDIEQVLRIAQVTWNAVILTEAKSNTFYLLDLKRQVAKQPASAAIVDSLIQRKREQYADDMRLIGDFQVLRRSGGLNLRVEAKSPFDMD